MSAVDSNGICNQGPCTEVACAGPTGDVDPLSSDYLKQAKAFASQYQPNVQVKGSIFDQQGGTTSGGGLGGDVTGAPSPSARYSTSSLARTIVAYSCSQLPSTLTHSRTFSLTGECVHH
jgi:hypothetical protein